MSTLGEQLSAVRERRGLTQGEVAQRAHLPQQAISRLERGDRTHVRSDVLARLAIALDVSADVLLGLQNLADNAEITPPAQPQTKRASRAATSPAPSRKAAQSARATAKRATRKAAPVS